MKAGEKFIIKSGAKDEKNFFLMFIFLITPALAADSPVVIMNVKTYI